MVFRMLSVQHDFIELRDLMLSIESTLDHKEWWLPVTEISKAHLCDPSWSHFVGAYSHGKLVGASALFLDSYEFGETLLALDLDLNTPTAEIGRCMVLPEYRGHATMLLMNRWLLKEAKYLGIQRVISTVHPDNTYSRNSLQELGMQYEGHVKKFYPRDVYSMEV